MSDQPTDYPRDPRRRRGQSTPPAGPETGSSEGDPAGTSPGTAEEVALSRTLFSFLEPALEIIGSYSAPLVVAGVVALVAGISLLTFVGSMWLYGVINIILGVVLIGLVVLIFFSSVVAAFFGRTGRYGINSLVMMSAFTGIILVIGFISFENHSRMDLTATNQFSLATRTKDLLHNLEEPVLATAFYKDNSRGDPESVVRRAKVEDTLKEFAARSGKFSYRIEDPDLKPDIAKKYFGAKPVDFVAESVVVEGQESKKFDVVEPRDQSYSQFEQDLVTSMLVATGKEQKSIYFLAGHGERSIGSSAPDGYDQLRAGLENDNYRVETHFWDPAETDVAVPDDAALLVIARPTGNLPEAHAKSLNRYMRGKSLDSGGNEVDRREAGRVIFLADVDTDQSFRIFLARWGVLANTGYILDTNRSAPGDPHLLQLGAYNPQAPLEIIFPRGEPLAVSLMPGATNLLPVGGGFRIPIPLAATSTESYLIADAERTEPITEPKDQADPKGPFFPAMLVRGVGAVEDPAPTAQPPDSDIFWLVVFGDSDFLANSFYGRGGGADLFLNSTNYLLGDFSLVSIRDKAFTYREFNLDRNEYNFVRFSSWFFLPGLLGLMAALVWWVRR